MKMFICKVCVVLVGFLITGCDLANQHTQLTAPIDAQLSVIRDSVVRSLYTQKVDVFERSEKARSQELVRFIAISLNCGIGVTQENGFEFDGFRTGRLADAVVAVDFFFVFQNEEEYVLVSNLFVPHIDNFRPLSSLNSTNGFYVLKIKRTNELTKQMEECLRSFGGEGATIQGHSKDLEDLLRTLYGRGIEIQALTHDGARVDVIEVNHGDSQLIRQIINPIRPTEIDGAYIDKTIEATDSVFQLLWSRFM
jgi:hypothetical protein